MDQVLNPEESASSNAAADGSYAVDRNGDAVHLPITTAHASHESAQPLATGGRFKVTATGVFFNASDDPTTDKLERVCGKLQVLAETRDRHSGQWGKLLSWSDPDGKPHEWVMPNSALQGDGAEVRRELAAGGLEIVNPIRLLRFLREAKTNKRARGVERTGWYRDGECAVFVLPGMTVGVSTEVVRLQSEVQSHTYKVAGTAEGWRTEVAALCAGNSHCLLAVSMAFAPPLLEFAGLESGGMNWMGSSSTGKTTTLYAAASVYGGHDFVNRWRATANGVEALAAQHNDTLLILDELAQIDPREAGQMAYMLANGQGKCPRRLNIDPPCRSNIDPGRVAAF